MPSVSYPSACTRGKFLPFNGAGRRVPGALAAGIAVIVWGLSTSPTQPALQASTVVINATSYGAICDGTMRMAQTGGSIDGNAIEQAVQAAGAMSGGATVLLPAGVCMLAQAIVIGGAAGIVLEGSTNAQGIPLTTLTDAINPQYEGGDIKVTSDHNTIQDLVLDQSSYGGTIYSDANYTTVQRATILGGPNSYSIFFVAQPSGAPSEGNKLLNSTVVALVDRTVEAGLGNMPCDDGLSWSNQDNSLIQNVSFTGTRLALYQDQNTTVNGFVYYPGPQTCDLDGYFITQPSNKITMSNLTMYGSGGIVSNGGTVNGISTNVTISNEHVLPPTAGFGFLLRGGSRPLLIRNVNGVTITNSDFDSGQVANSGITLDPTTAALNVVVSNSTTPRVAFAGAPAAAPAPAATTQAQFDNDTYSPYIWPASKDETFVTSTLSTVTFAIKGGWFHNVDPTNPPYFDLYKGTGATFTVTGLSGYTGPSSGS